MTYRLRIEQNEDDAFKLYVTVGNATRTFDYYYGAKVVKDDDTYIIEPNDIGKLNWTTSPQSTLIIHDDIIEVETLLPNRRNNNHPEVEILRVPKDMTIVLKRYLDEIIDTSNNDDIMIFPEMSYNYNSRRARAEAFIPPKLLANTGSKVANFLVGNKPSVGGKSRRSRKRRASRKNRTIRRSKA